MVSGVVPSETRTNGNRSMHMIGRTGVRLMLITGLVFLEVETPCSSPCARVVASSTSYVIHVSETQNHIYEEGNDARVGGEAT